MAQPNNTKELVDSVLRRAGELQDGTSSYQTQALDYVDQIHKTIISGGNEFDVDIDEPFIWSRAEFPIVFDLRPKFDTGTISLTLGANSGTFSSAPTESLEGWYIKVDNRSDIYVIRAHTSGGTAFDIDQGYLQDTGATLSFRAFKLDYELASDYVVINSSNNKISFEETSGTELTSTLTAGTYTPAELVTEIKTQMDTDGASVYTPSYSAVTRKYTILSDGNGGGGIFSLTFATGTNIGYTDAAAVLGMDTADKTGALTYTSDYGRERVSRLFEPAVVYKQLYSYYGEGNQEGNVYSVDEKSMQQDFPLNEVREGIPARYAQIKITRDGVLTVRFNRYPKEVTRIEFPYVPKPRDLQNNTADQPLVPSEFINVIENGALFYLLLDKEDTKAQGFGTLAATKLKALVRQARKELMRTGKFFGTVVPRPDNRANQRRRKFLIFGGPDS